MSLIVFYLLHSTSVLSLYIDVVLTLSNEFVTMHRLNESHIAPYSVAEFSTNEIPICMI